MVWKTFYIELPYVVKSFINAYFSTLHENEIANLDFVFEESEVDEEEKVHFYSRMFDLHFGVQIDTDEEIGYFVTFYPTKVPRNYQGDQEVIFVPQTEFQIPA